MFRAVLCTLALGVERGVAFQWAPGRLAVGWAGHVTELKATNNYGFTPMGEERQDKYDYEQGLERYGGPLPRHGANTAEPQPSARARRLQMNKQRQLDFGGAADTAGTFSAAESPAPAAPVALPSVSELKAQIEMEKGKPVHEKDYNQLKYLTSQLQEREAMVRERVVLQAELQGMLQKLQEMLHAAEAQEDFDRCQELQAQLLEVQASMEAYMSGAIPHSADQGASSGLATYDNGQNNGSTKSYDGPTPRGRGYGADISWASMEVDDGSDGDGKLVY